MKAVKIIWILSVVVIFLFNLFFDGYRIFDYALGNYSVRKMTIINSSYNVTSKRKSLTIDGSVNEGKVYFSRFDEDINELYNFYPSLSSKIKNTPIINVLKFKHSNNVILLDDDEFIQWKKHLLIYCSYMFFSVIFFILFKLYKN
ncbi:hypothetical protein [[Flexibacter] sp. ATCC 35103]|jgi:hypothetical protein|uniref:hypothetical protein n=1 Tax=[Flexibacter] sp. ATCC 35103 TaxID=1937528 RepID=UPI0009D3D86E|nr:hypothetical protein [[Flexibacter] sp. ATCC 35103]OMQ09280.1 hypothetical protein BXU01_18115 [[Flexibacter] sp. ATCC 35103]OMQ09330.1 hypothetical protein BXU01_18390 [[Flexibacter] sp. ATCC 35103]